MVLQTFWKASDVKHSYTVSKLPLQLWAAIRKNSTVLGYCTCMAGLAETSSHIAAILYWKEAAIHISNNNACTSKPNS